MNVLSAPSTAKIFGGLTPAQYHPALCDNRTKRDMLRKLKNTRMPEGRDSMGGVSLFIIQ